MGKLLLFVLLVFVAYLLFKGFRRVDGRSSGGADSPKHPAERMVTCALCGVHLPESESLAAGEKFFCCEEHRRLGA